MDNNSPASAQKQVRVPSPMLVKDNLNTNSGSLQSSAHFAGADSNKQQPGGDMMALNQESG